MNLEEAVGLVRAGRGVEAEQALTAELEAARARWGDASAHTAAALSDLATVRLATGDLSRAVEPLREAARIEATDAPDAAKQRLTYNMNLGDVLRRLGRAGEAVEVLREGLDARRALYGEDHAGYAYGLEPLATALLATGELDEAWRCADRALGLFWKHGNPRAAAAFASRAPLAKAKGVRAFEGADKLPDELFEVMVTEVLNDEAAASAEQRVQVLEELASVTEAAPRAAELHPHVLAALTEAARGAGKTELRLATLRRLGEWTRARGDLENQREVALGLASALDDVGRLDEADRAYDDAVAIARELGDVEKIVHALRTQAQFRMERGREAEGRARFDEALALGGNYSTERAKAAIALGIKLQHQGDAAQAEKLLRQGVGVLEPFDPDGLCGRSHLSAVERRDGSCGCGDMGAVMGEVVAEVVREQLPDDLLESIAFEPDGNVHVRLAREPKGDEEIAHLDVVMHQAIAGLRQSIRRW